MSGARVGGERKAEGCVGRGVAFGVCVGDDCDVGGGVGEEDGGFGKSGNAPGGGFAFGVSKGAVCGVVGMGDEVDAVPVLTEDVWGGEVDIVKGAALAMVDAGSGGGVSGEGEGLSGDEDGVGEWETAGSAKRGAVFADGAADERVDCGTVVVVAADDMFEEAAAWEGVARGDDAEGAGGVEVLADVGVADGEEGAAEGLAELGGVVVGVGVGGGVGLGGGGEGCEEDGANDRRRGEEAAERGGVRGSLMVSGGL